MILWDMSKYEKNMIAEDFEPYIYAYGTRYEECRIDRGYVDNYLSLLEAGKQREEYNRVFADFQRRFPDQRNRSASPGPPDAAPGPSR